MALKRPAFACSWRSRYPLLLLLWPDPSPAAQFAQRPRGRSPGPSRLPAGSGLLPQLAEGPGGDGADAAVVGRPLLGGPGPVLALQVLQPPPGPRPRGEHD